MRGCALGVVCAVLLACCSALLPQVEGRADLKVFRDYGLLQCSGCELMAKVIGRRMNDTAKKHGKETMAKGVGFRKKKVGYQGSEAQAVDVLELLCPDVRKKSAFKIKELNQDSKEQVRLFREKGDSGDETPDAEFYTDQEGSKTLINPVNQLEDMCEDILDGFDDVLTGAIMRNREYEPLFDDMCISGLRLCDIEFMKDAVRKEKTRHEEWLERKETQEEEEYLKKRRKRNNKKKAEEKPQAEAEEKKEEEGQNEEKPQVEEPKAEAETGES